MISARRRLRCQGDRIAGALRQLLQRAEERGVVARLRRVEQTQRLTKPLRVESGVLPGEGAPKPMQAPGGAGVVSGREMLGITQSPFVLAQAQDFCARRSRAQRQAAPQRAGEERIWEQDAGDKSEAGAGGEKGGGALLLRSPIDARPCGKRPIIQRALWRRGLGGRPSARARCGRRAGRGRREKRIQWGESHRVMMA